MHNAGLAQMLSRGRILIARSSAVLFSACAQKQSCRPPGAVSPSGLPSHTTTDLAEIWPENLPVEI